MEARMPEIKQERYEDSLVYRVRHSSAHIMAQAVLEKFPTAKIAIGPAIEEGYYTTSTCRAP
jgi:threonyl-tRNA synthetase